MWRSSAGPIRRCAKSASMPRRAASSTRPTHERLHQRFLAPVHRAAHAAVDRRLRPVPEVAKRAQGGAGGNHRPPVGRRPRRVQQSAAALVELAVLPHHRVLPRLSRALSRPGQLARHARLEPGRAARRGAAGGRKAVRAALPQVRRSRGRDPGEDTRGAGDRAEAVPQQLRAMPRLRRRRLARLSQSHRPRLAVGRGRKHDQGDDHRGPHRRDAAVRRRARRRGGEERGELRALVLRPYQRLAARRVRPRALPAELRRLPRRRGQGKRRARRAEPRRQDLAARLRGAGGDRDHHQGPHQPHAGAQGAARRGAHPPADGVRPVAFEVNPNDGSYQQISLFEVRQKIYPRAVRGWFAAWRWALVWATQLVFYGGAWLTWNERQALLFDVAHRKFYLFGLVFWPQDIIYLAVLLIVCALSLFLFTAVAGRLWCGYACPQTVYTEIFLWIERVVEGDRNARMRLDKENIGWRKLGLKGTKHFLWIAL